MTAPDPVPAPVEVLEAEDLVGAEAVELLLLLEDWVEEDDFDDEELTVDIVSE
ncbi:MAG: hypothetical protein WC314_17370 [Vulcanimicrobiota bacterium]